MTPATKRPSREALLKQVFGDADVPAGVDDLLLRTSDVALLFEVSERTVSEWARTGRIASIRTPGGHRRYPAAQVRALLQSTSEGMN